MYWSIPDRPARDYTLGRRSGKYVFRLLQNQDSGAILAEMGCASAEENTRISVRQCFIIWESFCRSAF